MQAKCIPSCTLEETTLKVTRVEGVGSRWVRSIDFVKICCHLWVITGTTSPETTNIYIYIYIFFFLRQIESVDAAVHVLDIYIYIHIQILQING